MFKNFNPNSSTIFFCYTNSQKKFMSKYCENINFRTFTILMIFERQF